jgi:hypothetical protein
VGVEKLFPAKSATIKSCQDAPQTTFSVFLDIFYLQNYCCFEENGVFQQPRLITSTIGVTTALGQSLAKFVARSLDSDSAQILQLCRT